MKVECELNTYNDDIFLDFKNPLIIKDIQHRELVKFIIKDVEFIVNGDELISAIQKCQLNCFGR